MTKLEEGILPLGFVEMNAGGGCRGYSIKIGDYDLWLSGINHPHTYDDFPCGFVVWKDDEVVDLSDFIKVYSYIHILYNINDVAIVVNVVHSLP